MLCPFCREKDTSVVDSRPTEDGTAIRRRRFCTCNGGQRFTTFERVQFREVMVIKNNGRKSVFDRDKLTKSIMISLRKRPVAQETIEKIHSNNQLCKLIYLIPTFQNPQGTTMDINRRKEISKFWSF